MYHHSTLFLFACELPFLYYLSFNCLSLCWPVAFSSIIYHSTVFLFAGQLPSLVLSIIQLSFSLLASCLALELSIIQLSFSLLASCLLLYYHSTVFLFAGQLPSLVLSIIQLSFSLLASCLALELSIIQLSFSLLASCLLLYYHSTVFLFAGQLPSLVLSIIQLSFSLLASCLLLYYLSFNCLSLCWPVAFSCTIYHSTVFLFAGQLPSLVLSFNCLSRCWPVAFSCSIYHSTVFLVADQLPSLVVSIIQPSFSLLASCLLLCYLSFNRLSLCWPVAFSCAIYHSTVFLVAGQLPSLVLSIIQLSFSLLASCLLLYYLSFNCLSRCWPVAFSCTIYHSTVFLVAGQLPSLVLSIIQLSFSLLASCLLLYYLSFNCLSRCWPVAFSCTIYHSTVFLVAGQLPSLVLSIIQLSFSLLASCLLLYYLSFNCLSRCWPVAFSCTIYHSTVFLVAGQLPSLVLSIIQLSFSLLASCLLLYYLSFNCLSLCWPVAFSCTIYHSTVFLVAGQLPSLVLSIIQPSFSLLVCPCDVAIEWRS